MSLPVLAERGKKALEAKNYDDAITQYSAAIEQAPESPDLFIQRSVANQRAKKYTEALQDAEQAVLNAMKRAKRELIIEAQFRRGQALYHLKRPGDACYVLGLVMSKSKDHKEAGMWNNMAKKALEALATEDPLRNSGVPETPVARGSATTVPKGAANSSTSGPDTSSVTTASKTTSAPQQTPVDKIRHDWYQTSERIHFTLLAKGVPKDKTQIDIAERSLTVEFPLLSGSSYQLTLEPLFAAVNPDKCVVSVLPSKVEIVLAKATAGQKWASLESTTPAEDVVVKNTIDEAETSKPAASVDHSHSAPAYPTSSKKGAKDWDKIVGGHDDEDETSGDPNDFFKKLFKGANPDMQRAMMKSYQESNGTSLSTNWDEVKKGKVETLPPDGMEAKSWN